MAHIRINKFNVIDYFVVILLVSLTIYHSWNYSDEIKGVIGTMFIEYDITQGVVYKSELKLNRIGKGVMQEIYDIWYKYSVNDKSYISNQITYNAKSLKVDEYIMKYPIGKIVTVYYQSNKHDFSVLEPDNTSILRALRPFTGLLIAIIYLAYKKRIELIN